MGLFCFDCDWLYGCGPGLPDIIHMKNCPHYNEEYYKKRYPKLDVDKAKAIARQYGDRDYALKMHTLSPAYKRKEKLRARNKLKWKARRGDLKAKRRLRPNISRMFRMVACKIRSRTREHAWSEANRRIADAWHAKRISTGQLRSEQKKLLEIFREGASKEELDTLYLDI